METLKVITIDRAQFYEELWTYTGQELRIRYAMSPYGLQQLCIRLKLTEPPVGYWMKLRHGKSPRRPQLRPLEDPALNRVCLLANDMEHCRLRYDSVPVPPTLADPHPITEETRDRCSSGVSGPPAPVTGTPSVAFVVSKRARDRALRILDTLCKAFEQSGGQIFKGPQGVLWGRAPDGVGLSIREFEEAGTGSGRLALDFTTNAQVAIKHHWADNQNLDVETALRPLLNAIFESAARIRWQRLDSECEYRQRTRMGVLWQAQKQREQAAIQQQYRGEDLVQQAREYADAALLRRYARAIQRRLSEADLPSAAVSEATQRAREALAHAEKIDPLSKYFPPRASERAAVNLTADELDISSKLRLYLAQLSVSDTQGMHSLLQTKGASEINWTLRREMESVLELCDAGMLSADSSRVVQSSGTPR